MLQRLLPDQLPRHQEISRANVDLDANVFQRFDKKRGQKCDVIDLWAAIQGLSLRAAALDLVNTFGLEPAPRGGTEKRNG